jgi:hypothetical protein
MLHPITGDSIFLIEDMPHLVKRLVNGLETSSKKDVSRDFKYDSNQPMNLNMIRTVWENIGGNTLRLQETKLTMQHFVKDGYSKMRVPLAVQITSESTANMLEKFRQENSRVSGLYTTQYKRLIEMIRLVNELIDIVNGRTPKSKGCYANHVSAKNARSTQERLLTILSFFADWDASVKKDKKCDIENFLAPETWKGLQRMILGYVGMIKYYVVGMGDTIVPKRTTSDSCEHYFSRARASFGGSNQNGVSGFHDHRRHEQVRSSNGYIISNNVRGNSGSAPVDVKKEGKRKHY